MNVTALSKKVRKYTPKELRGQEGAPVFMLRSLTRFENLEIMSNSDIDIPANIVAEGDTKDVAEKLSEKLAEGSMGALYRISLNSLKTNLEILRIALSGWETIKDEEGDEVKFSSENIELLSDDLMTDLVQEVTGVTDEVTEKNSGKESPSLSGSEKETTQESGTAATVKEKSSSEPETVKEDTSQRQ